MKYPGLPKRGYVLIAATLLTCFWTIIITNFVVNTFLDTYDAGLYYQAMTNVFSWMLPWVNGVDFRYPPLAIVPMAASYLMSIVTGDQGWFLISMWILMIVCEIITVFCVYLIARKMYPEYTAFIAALLTATAISSTYFTLTKFDAFPTALMMLAILFTVYEDKTKGYLMSVAGMFAKLFPVGAFPFIWIYNSEGTSLIYEGKKRVFWIAGISAALLAGFWVMGYNRFLEYASEIYCDTIPYLVSQYLSMAGINIPFPIISNVFRILTVIAILLIVWWAVTGPKTIARMIQCTLLSILVVVFFSQYRSPEYIVWFTPLIALLSADSYFGIALFSAIQFIEYIDFPWGFNKIWVNANYTSQWAIPFFTIYFLIYGVLVLYVIRKKRLDWVGFCT
ncbi:MAG: hypothetical protein ABSE74_06505 [Methanoregula sp.]|jgi:hypothetical protein